MCIRDRFGSGKIYALLGENGAGKSTLVKILSGVVRPDKGEVFLNDKSIKLNSPLDAKKNNIGMVFQHFNLFPHLTTLENCTLAPIWVRETPEKEASEIAMEMLEKVKIPEQAHKYPGQLSGGQQQRVAIARSLCMLSLIHI